VLTWTVWIGIAFSSFVLVELIRLNILLVRTLKREKKLDVLDVDITTLDHPLVSVVIPAKDEEQNIEHSVRSILESTYDRMELVLVNDRSRDGTERIMESMSGKDSRIKTVTLDDLPEGWTGKTHALYQGAERASGDILLFTDADTVLSPDAIAVAAKFLLTNKLDMLSLLPQFVERGFSENAVYPHLALGFSSMYPLTEVNDPDKEAALASGCFIMIRREAYNQVGSWKRYRQEICEDVALSKSVKAARLKLNVMRGGNLVRTKPFGRLMDVCRFWKRTFYGGLNKSILKILRLTANYVVLTILFGVFVFSVGLLVAGLTEPQNVLLVILSTLALSAVVIPYGFVVQQEQGSWWYGLTAPLGMVISAAVAISALFAVVSGRGIQWRGSVYK
jgi:chlorobactene glucosyltransferase